MVHRRVIYFVREWPAASEAFLREEVKALLDQGHDIQVWAIKAASDGADHLDAQSLAGKTRVLWPPDVRLLLKGVFLWLLRRPVLLCSLFWKSVTGDHPDINSRFRGPILIALGCYAACIMEREGKPMRAHGNFAYSGALVARVASALLAIPYSLTVYSSDFKQPQGLMRLKLASADPLVTVSHASRSYLLNRWPWLDASKVRVVHTGVDSRRFVPAPKGVHPEGVHILTVARMTPEKNPLGLVAAAKVLRDKGISVSWRWIGDGPLMKRVRDSVEGSELAGIVSLMGWVSHAQIITHYHWADILVLGSLREGLPVSVMEAMACGVPVVATAVDGLPELIMTGVNGLLVPPNDPAVLADAVASIVVDRNERLRMGSAARKTILEGFDLSTNVAHLWDMFTQTQGGADSRPYQEGIGLLP